MFDVHKWLKMLDCVRYSENVYFLLGRYKIELIEKNIQMSDSFDDFKLLGSDEIKDLEHLIDFTVKCINKVKKWN